MEIHLFEGDDTPHRALGRNSENGPPAELTVLTDPERRIAEFRSYRALVDRVYEEACDNRTQALPELREIRARHVEIFDRIESTQAPRDVGSVLPRSFNPNLRLVSSVDLWLDLRIYAGLRVLVLAT